MKIILAFLLFVVVANAAFIRGNDTPAIAAAKMKFFARYNYEASRMTNRARSLGSLSYDEALIADPVMMENMARSNYETDRKAFGDRAMSYDEAVAFSRSG